MSLILDGTLGASAVQVGAVTTAKLPVGTVLQVVTANTTTEVSTSSTSFVTTGFSASITPSSATSKIFILTTAPVSTPSTNVVNTSIYRGASNLGSAGEGFGRTGAGALTLGGDFFTSMSYLDSPATTSSTTYTVYYKTTASAAYFSSNGGKSTITLMEIAA